jgi:hypothetical protein
MNHLEQDESPDWNDDVDAFENQLRSLCPTPPARTWSSVSDSIETSINQAPTDFDIAPSPATSMWTPIISHSITAAIGLAFGVALMWMQMPSDNQVANDQSPAEPTKAQAIAAESKTQDTALIADKASSNHRSQPKQTQPSHRFGRTNWNSTTLRVFGSTNKRLASGRDWMMESNADQRLSQPENSDEIEADYKPIDKPVLSPGSFRRILDDLTCLPILVPGNCKIRDMDGSERFCHREHREKYSQELYAINGLNSCGTQRHF